MSVQIQKGFSLFELLTVIAIMAIVAALAVPGMQSFQRNARISGLSSDVASSLALARTSAVTQRRNVMWTHTTSPVGWQLQWDSTTGPVFSRHAVTEGNPATLALYLPPETTASTVTQLRFEPSGLVKRGDTEAAVDFEFRICTSDVDNETGRSVRLSKLGRLVANKHPSASVCAP